MLNEILITESNEAVEKLEASYKKNWNAVREQGLCPTCENFKHHNIFLEDDDLTLFENDLFKVILEQKPRRSGHTIIIVKPHYDDISEMPIHIAEPLFLLTNKIISAIKKVLGATKVYFVTMCDGGPNHLHFQLIPRYEGEDHGSKVFVGERKRIKKDMLLINNLKYYINE